MVKNKSKILILAAHADDEVLGAGGIISKHVEDGDEVYVCVVTKGYMPQWSEKYISNKIIEQEKVDNFPGIKRRFNLDFPTVTLNTIPTGNWMYPIIELNEKLPEEFSKLIIPNKTLLQDSESISKNKKKWINEWLASMTK